MRQTLRLVSLVGVLALIELATNIFNGPVAEDLPPQFTPALWPALALALGLLILVTWAFARLQRGPVAQEPQLSHRLRYQFTAFLLITADALLAAIAGVLSNLAATALPTAWKPYTPELLLGVTVVGVALTWGVFQEESGPATRETNRANFRLRLITRYTRRREDALRDAVLLTLGIQREPAAVTASGVAYAPLQGGVIGEAQPLSEGGGILSAFDTAQGQLLILGEPGAGMTTQLVELGLVLLRRDPPAARRRRQPAPPLPAPVIVSLASWAVRP